MGRGFALLLLWLAAGCAPERTPDILLITVDTLRADRLGCYGHAGAYTPNMDRLAREGVRYDQCQSPAPITLPAHATIMTGATPPELGVRNNATYRLPSSRNTLAEELKAAGYSTAAFVAALPLEARTGLDQGFEFYDDTLPTKGSTDYHLPERPGGEVVRAALQWLDSQSDASPVFVWVHLFEPHHPYAPPADLARRFAEDLYDGEVAAADRHIGELLEGWSSRREHDQITLLSSDHGEGLGDHGEESHALFLYQTTLRVPLILHAPGLLPAGLVHENPVGLIDVAPTLLQLAGLSPAPLEATGLALDPAAEAPADRSLYSETVYPYEGYRWSPAFALRRGSQKFIRSARSRAFDLEADPEELSPLGESFGEAGLKAVDREVQRLRALAPDQGEAARLDKVDAEALAALGYVGSTVPTRQDELLAEVARRPDPIERQTEARALSRAEGLLLSDQPEAALEELKAVLISDAENPWAWMLRAQALDATGDQAAALSAYDRLNALRPGWIPVLHRRADLLRRAGRVDEALLAYADLRVHEPKQLRGWMEAAAMLQEEGNFSAAASLLHAALAEELPDAPLQAALARVELQRGNLEAGRAALRKANSADPALYLLEGRYLVAEGRHAEAVDHLKARPASLRDDSEALQLLADSYRRTNQPEDAVGAYIRAAERGAGALPLNNAAWLLATTLGRSEEALPLAREAVRLEGANWDFHDTLVEALLAADRAEEARRHLQSLPVEARRSQALAPRFQR